MPIQKPPPVLSPDVAPSDPPSAEGAARVPTTRQPRPERLRPKSAQDMRVRNVLTRKTNNNNIGVRSSAGSLRVNYAPAVPSPLGIDRSTGTGDNVSRDRSVRPRLRSTPGLVVEHKSELQEKQGLRGDAEKTGWERQHTTTPSLRAYTQSPAVSLQSVGLDFSRYPSRMQSKSSLALPISLGASFHEPKNGLPTSDPEKGLSTYSQQQNDPIIYPGIEEEEDDDDLHSPGNEDEETVGCLRNFRKCPPRKMLSCFFLFSGLIGLVLLFIAGPVIGNGILPQLKHRPPAPPDPPLTRHNHTQLKAIRTSMVDPDTPGYAMTRKSLLGKRDLKLVFSDEFNTDGRTFYEGEDQFWTAPDFHYAATNDLEWYDPDAVTTKDGTLQLRLERFRNHNLDYRSGMLQSWNKLCFKGGVLEVSVSLAGPGGVPGLWPGVWTLGNLVRPGYKSTSDGVWPYSYNECDVGITPNQSSTDGISFLPGQRLAKCTCSGEDHPSPGVGRGAPEIDVLEASADSGMRVGVITQSNQVAPFDIWYIADHDYLAIQNPEVTLMNPWRGGPFQQAVSGVTILNNDWYDGIEFQKYGFEYTPGQADGMVAWFVGDEETFRMSGAAVRPNGNIGQRDVAFEPMSIVLNLGFSTSWTWIDWEKLEPRLLKGTVMHIDYVRIYQEEGQELLTCDPPGYPTTEYIRKHPKAYQNWNMTLWEETGYPWPKNKLMHDC